METRAIGGEKAFQTRTTSHYNEHQWVLQKGIHCCRKITCGPSRLCFLSHLYMQTYCQLNLNFPFEQPYAPFA